MPNLLLLSASELARRIQARELTSRDALEAHITRIEAVNGRLNAMVQPRFDAARLEADEADRVIKTADPASLPPFFGVPCSIKEAFELTGMPNSAGL